MGEVKKAVYTAITGNYDTPTIPFKNPEWDYFLFTDNPDIKSDVWEVVLLKEIGVPTNKLARKVKILSHKYLPDYSVTLWVDGNIKLLKDPQEFCDAYLKGDIALMEHGRDCIYAEAEACKRRGKDTNENIDRQIRFLKAEQFPEKQGMVNTGIMIRVAGQNMQIVMEHWWTIVALYSHRDQLSFNYSMWKHPLLIKSYFPYQLNSPTYFSQSKHGGFVSKNKGVIILAAGNPTYGEWAFNLALSIKKTSDLKIAVLVTLNSLSTLDNERKAYFDEIITISESEYKIGKKHHYQRIKTGLYFLSPFEETLYIDADSLITQDITSLFGSEDFKIANMGYYDFDTNENTATKYIFWADVNQTKKHYKLSGKMPQTYSGLIYFRKSAAAEKIFKKAREVYDDQSNRKLVQKWADDLPDEFCFNVALAGTPMEYNWMPVFFSPFHDAGREPLRRPEIEKFYGHTLAGNRVSTHLKNLVYLHWVRKFCFPNIRVVIPQDKADVIKERKNW